MYNRDFWNPIVHTLLIGSNMDITKDFKFYQICFSVTSGLGFFSIEFFHSILMVEMLKCCLHFSS